MIVPMKKIAIIVQKKDASQALRKLAKEGILHIEQQRPPEESQISQLQEDLALVKRSLQIILEEEVLEHCLPQEIDAHLLDWKSTCQHIIDLWKRQDYLEEYSKKLKEQINQWQIWGDFQPQDIQQLAQKNIYLRFYEIPRRELHNLPKNVIVKKINMRQAIVYCLVISREKIELPFKELTLPRMSLSQMKVRLLEDAKIKEEIRCQLNRYLAYQKSLAQIKEKLEKEWEFKKALYGMGANKDFSYLVGFAPSQQSSRLMDLARKEKWGILISEPKESDNVPTLIRNPKWMKMIQPVFKLLEIVPGYRELDISMWFLIFLSIFFGMLVGDAGYGAVYFLLTWIFHQKLGKQIKQPAIFFLFYTLSFCAMIWGLCIGNFFGQAWLLKAGFQPLLPALNNPRNIQAFCFFLGALHLSIAHLWQAIIKLPSLTSLAELGWIGILWSAFYLAKALILGEALPAFWKGMFLCAFILVVLFISPKKNIFAGIAAGTAKLALNLVNNFTDIVSYVRLFAVGLASVAIADTFNNMAAGLDKDNLFMFLLSIAIIIVGHFLNLLLGPMSVLVHGVRLNVLEFSSHANVTWSGISYKPFKIENAEEIWKEQD